MFSPEDKRTRHEKVFPDEMKKAFVLGAEMAEKPWK